MERPDDNGYSGGIFDEEVQSLIGFEDTLAKYREVVAWLNDVSLGDHHAAADESLGLLVEQLEKIELRPEID